MTNQKFVPIMIILLFMLTDCFTVQGPVNPNTDTYMARKTTHSPVIDGDPSDKSWDQARWWPIAALWLGEAPTAEDFTGAYKILWTEEKLYFLVKITDDILSDLYKDPFLNYWEDDCLEIFIDEDASGGGHERNYNAFAYHIALDYNVVDIDIRGRAILLNDHLDIKHKQQGNIYYWEAAVSVYSDRYRHNRENIPERLVQGKEIGYALAYCDNDGSYKRDNFMGSIDIEGVDKNQAWHNADVFGKIRLVK